MRRFFLVSVLVATAIVGISVIQFRESTARAEDVLRPLADAKKQGWWIKICPKKTEVDSISFRIGPDKDNINETITWKRGDLTEIDLTKNVGDAKVYCYAKVSPRGKNGYFGLCFKEQVCCKHYDFDDDEDHDVKQGDKDEWKCE